MTRYIATALLLCASLLALPAPAAAQTTFTDLGTIGAAATSPRDTNSSGHVAGVAETADGSVHGFVWTPSTGMIDLGTLAGSGNSQADFITNSGLVVGSSDVNEFGDRHAFAWTLAGGMVDLGTLGGDYSEAVDVNEAGQVVGNTHDASFNTRAFLWTAAAGMIDLGTLGGDYAQVSAISEAGHVVGAAGIATNEQHAFRWTVGGGMVDLGTLGGNYSAATGVNDIGQVIGDASLADFSQRAFSWTAAGGMVDLGTLGGEYSQPAALNNAGQVVGRSANAAGDGHAFSWTASGGMIDLGTLGGSQSEASAVGASGVVIGSSSGPGDTSTRGFVWTGAGALIDPGAPFTGSASIVAAVSPSGQVVGYAYADPTDTGIGAFSWTQAGGFVDLGNAGGDITAAFYILTNGNIVGVANFAPGEVFRSVLITVEAPDSAPPSISVTGPAQIWPPNGKMVAVTYTGTITDAGSGVASASFTVIDEYGTVHPSGTITIAPNGTFTKTVMLEASRNGNDKNGREYRFVVTAVDHNGNSASKSATTVVPHDQGKK